MQRFELIEGKSSKFWEVQTEGESLTVRYGRIGTNGQTQTKTFASADAALKERDKLIKEKTGKGYAEVSVANDATLTAVAPKAPKEPQEPKAPAPPLTRRRHLHPPSPAPTPPISTGRRAGWTRRRWRSLIAPSCAACTARRVCRACLNWAARPCSAATSTHNSNAKKPCTSWPRRWDRAGRTGAA